MDTQEAIHQVQRVIGGHLRERRTSLGWSQQELARRARVSTDFISQAERGRRAPSITVLTRISCVFGVEPYELMVPPNSAPSESAPLRDLHALLAGKTEDQVRMVWKLARVALDELPSGREAPSPVRERTTGRKRQS